MANVILDFLFLAEEEEKEAFLLLLLRVRHNGCFSSCPLSLRISRSIATMECKGIRGNKPSIFIEKYDDVLFFYFWDYVTTEVPLHRVAVPFFISTESYKYLLDILCCKQL